MKKLILLLVLGFGVIQSQALTLNPSTFTVSNLNSITNGTTVELVPGTYNVNQAILNAWTNGSKTNVTFKRSGGTGTVWLKGNFSTSPELKFTYWHGLVLENLKITNMIPTINRCDNVMLNRLTIEGQQFSGPYVGKSALGILRGTNVTVKDCNIKWSYTGWNGKGVKSWKGVGHKFINNRISGGLRGAYDLDSGPSDPKANALIDGGLLTRDVSSGAEDHGIYAHDLSGIEIKNVTITGFTNSSAGGAIKLKNIDDVNVHHSTFNTSGILLRVEFATWKHLDNIWIHHNTFNDPMGVAHWSPGFEPEAIVVENNQMCNSTVILQSTGSKINKYCAVASKNGGVFNNTTGQALQIPSGTNNSGNSLCGGGGGGFVHMKKRNSQGFAIDGGGGGANFNPVKLFSSNTGNNNQKWEEISRGGGYYSYKKKGYNFCIDGGNGGANGQLVILYSCSSGNQNQHWKKIYAGSGSYRLEKRNAPGYSLDGGNGGANNRQLKLWASNQNNQNQHWVFSSVSRVGDETVEEVETLGSGVSVYPNPSQGAATISFDLQEAGDISLSIIDISGNEVASLYEGYKDAGNHQVTWAAGSTASGVFFVKLQTASFAKTTKLLITE